VEAVVLAGGLGTRLRKLVSDVPKPMAPVAGRPFLEILLAGLRARGFDRVVLAVGHKANVIINHFGRSFYGLDIDHVVEDSPLGTGGAIRMGLSRCITDHAFVFNGDTYLDLEAAKVEQLWQRHRRPIVVARSVPDTASYGRLLVESGRVVGFTEKGISGPGLINAGCYVLGTGDLDDFPLLAAFSIEHDFFARVVSKTYIDFYETCGTFIDIGVPEDYLRANTILANRV
jgi:D-glycero-alpha-D-manno-heptose 1-phosphate guanylyltransferase